MQMHLHLALIQVRVISKECKSLLVFLMINVQMCLKISSDQVQRNAQNIELMNKLWVGQFSSSSIEFRKSRLGSTYRGCTKPYLKKNLSSAWARGGIKLEFVRNSFNSILKFAI